METLSPKSMLSKNTSPGSFSSPSSDTFMSRSATNVASLCCQVVPKQSRQTSVPGITCPWSSRTAMRDQVAPWMSA